MHNDSYFVTSVSTLHSYSTHIVMAFVKVNKDESSTGAVKKMKIKIKYLKAENLRFYI